LAGVGNQPLQPMPDAFRLAIRYRNQLDAYSSSFYPGVSLADDVTIEFETKDWFEILRLLQFVK
jgi:D-amino peptidase